MIYKSKKQATTGLWKPLGQNWEWGSNEKWWLLIGGVQVWGGVRVLSINVFSQWKRWAKTSVHTFSNLTLKIWTEPAVTTEAGGVLQRLKTPSETADPLLSRWFVPWSPLSPRGALFGRVEREGEKQVRKTPKRPVNILKAVVRSARSHRRIG